MLIRGSVPVLLLILFLGVPPGAAQVSDEDCLSCHGDSGIDTLDPADLADMVEAVEPDVGRDPARILWRARTLFASSDDFAGTPHEGMACTDCHADVEEIPHKARLEPAACGLCHDTAQEELSAGIHGVRLAAGVAEAPRCGDCHGVHRILPISDPESLAYRKNEPALCTGCHGSAELGVSELAQVMTPADGYSRGIHNSLLIEEGNLEAATCSDCHQSHEIRRLGDPESSVYFTHIPQTCGQCHTDISELYGQSVHGEALALGNRDAPNCTDCHGEHEILPSDNPLSSVYAATLSQTTCSSCHDSLRLTRRYDMAGQRGLTYRTRYHGLATSLGSTSVANCASCHGVHNILPSTDPRSQIHPDNLVETCSKCHENAGPKFASGSIHALLEKPQHPFVALVRQFYLVLIVVVIAGMAVHNFMVWFRAVIEKKRSLEARNHPTRFILQERLQHIILVLSFLVLAITGFALKYPESKLVGVLLAIGMNEELRSLVHRIAGVVLIIGSAYHALFLGLTRRGKFQLRSILPRWPDVREFTESLKYYVGRRMSAPPRARYSYGEKVEYWALVWGTAIMSLTGLALWFPSRVTQWFPFWTIDLAEVIHFYEAILATLAILIWHLFFAMYHPAEYPLNLSIFTGRSSEPEEFEEENVAASAGANLED